MSTIDKFQKLLGEAVADSTLKREVLQEHFLALEEAEEQNKANKETIEYLKKQNNELHSSRNALSNKLAEWEKREMDLVAREKQAEVLDRKLFEATIYRQTADDKAAMAERLVTSIFRNTEMRKKLTGEQPLAIPGSRDCLGFAGTGTVNTEETISEE